MPAALAAGIPRMLAPANLLLITALAALVGLCVLGSLWRSGMPGIREAVWANLMTIVAMVLISQQNAWPAWLGIVAANLLFASGGVTFLIGVQRFLGQAVHTKWLVAALAAMMTVLVYYTYGEWRFDRRMVAASTFYAALLLFLALSIWRSRRDRFGYSQIFLLCLSVVAAIGQIARIYVYGTQMDTAPMLLAPTAWNIIFLSLSVVFMPSLTLGMIMMIHDRMLHEREREANIDFLTGLLTRKAWWSTTLKLGEDARKSGRPLAMLVLDIDHFKQVNDSLGHAAGDAVLRHFASVAMAALRPGDALGRLGGEEFAAALPGASPEEACELARRMLAALLAVPCQFGDIQLRYTFSGGVSQWDGLAPLQSALVEADGAMYAAKQAGRSRVNLAA